MSNVRQNASTETQPFMMYRGKPLVRCGNVIYYGNMTDKYVIQMEAKKPIKVENLDVSSVVSVTMLETNSESGNIAKIIKSSEKPGLYPAMDIAQIWLSRAES